MGAGVVSRGARVLDRTNSTERTKGRKGPIRRIYGNVGILATDSRPTGSALPALLETTANYRQQPPTTANFPFPLPGREDADLLVEDGEGVGELAEALDLGGLLALGVGGVGLSGVEGVEEAGEAVGDVFGDLLVEHLAQGGGGVFQFVEDGVAGTAEAHLGEEVHDGHEQQPGTEGDEGAGGSIEPGAEAGGEDDGQDKARQPAGGDAGAFEPGLDVFIELEPDDEAAQGGVHMGAEAAAQLAFFFAVVVGGHGGVHGEEDAAALRVEEALELMHVFFEHEADLAPAVAGAVLELLKKAVVEALWAGTVFGFLILGGFALEGLARGEGVAGESGHAHDGFVVVALGGIECGEDFFQCAVHLELALGLEFLEDAGLALGLVHAGDEALAHGVENLPREAHGAGELVEPGGIVPDDGGDVCLQGVKAAVLQQALALDAGIAGEEGFLGGDGEEGEVAPEALARELTHVVGDDLDLFGAAQIALL